MEKIELKCPGCITRGLRFVDGKIEEVKETIDCYDELTVEVSKRLYSKIKMTNRVQCLDEDNILNRICNEYFSYVGIKDYHVLTQIKKMIPQNIGMGGLYSDASGILVGLDIIFKTNLSVEELMSIANKVNPKISYFIVGGLRKIDTEGNITPFGLEKKESYQLVVAPPIKIDTNAILSQVNYNKEKSTHLLGNNDYEDYICEELKEYKKLLLEYKARYVNLNGLNSAFVAVFDDYHQRFETSEEMKKRKCLIYKCKPFKRQKLLIG